MTKEERKAKQVWFYEKFDLLKCLSCDQKGLKKNGEYALKGGDPIVWCCPTCYEALSDSGKEDYKQMRDDAIRQKIEQAFSRCTNG